MPQPSTFTLPACAAGNAAIVAAAQLPAGAGKLALVGGGPVVLDVARKVLVTYGVEGAARAITIKGTTFGGAGPIQETLAVPAGAAGTVQTVQDFASVAEVDVFSAWTANVSVGTQSAAAAAGPVRSTPFLILDPYRDPVIVNFGVNAAAYGTGYEVEVTFDDPNAGFMGAAPFNGLPPSNQPQSNVPPFMYAEPVNFAAKKTTNFVGQFTGPYFACRGTTWDTTALQFQFWQAGLRGA